MKFITGILVGLSFSAVLAIAQVRDTRPVREGVISPAPSPSPTPSPVPSPTPNPTPSPTPTPQPNSKITVGKYVYQTLDPNGIHTNEEGFRYNSVTGYLGFFLRDGTIYFQGLDCDGATTYPPCYYEYGVEEDYPRFLYGNAPLPLPQ